LACEILPGLPAEEFGFEDQESAKKIIFKKLITLKLEALESLGAAYYSYPKQEKEKHYSRSQAKIGRILSLYYFY
jgi:hypothetical protein